MKLRNLSDGGAMLEVDAEADVGTSLMISRGTLRAAGVVVWRGENFFGVRFFEPIKASEWLFLPIKAELPLSDGISAGPQDLPEELLRRRIAEEVAYVARMTNSVSDLLSADPVLRLRHTMSLQELCIGEQMLREIAVLLQQDLSSHSIQAQASGSMRNRLLRACL